MSLAEQETLVGITDIAEMARAKRATASNWPKRYDDFPKPRMVTSSGALFDADEVERWLIVKGKIDGPIPPEVRLWRLVDRLRGPWSLGAITELLAACIVYIESGLAGARTGSDISVDASDAWKAVRASHPPDVFAAVVAAAHRIEVANPMVSGLITSGIDQSPRPDDALLGQILDLLAAAAAEGPLDELFNEALGRLAATDRSFGANTTPPDLGELLIRLARPISGVVFDPAAGMSGLLQSAALYPDTSPRPDLVIGYELNDQIARLARAQSFLYGIGTSATGVSFRIECRDSLRGAADLEVEADLVLLDPPFNLREWGNTDLYLNNEIWRFGLPSPRSADFAWTQVAINSLKPDGRAIVVLPAGAATAGGRDERIRMNLVEAGCVESVIFLPARFGRDSSVALSIWILRRPQSERSDWVEPPKDILLVDASRLGARSPVGQWADELDISDIVDAAHWGRDGWIADPSIAIAVSREVVAESGNLSFKHYQPLPAPPDLADLEREVEELRGSLQLAADRLSDRMAELSELLGDQT